MAACETWAIFWGVAMKKVKKRQGIGGKHMEPGNKMYETHGRTTGNYRTLHPIWMGESAEGSSESSNEGISMDQHMASHSKISNHPVWGVDNFEPYPVVGK